MNEFEWFLADLWGEDGESPPAAAPDERAQVHAAIRRGVTDENSLSDMLFFARHPERGGRFIARDEPGFGQLSREWLGIRDTLVRPILASYGPPGLHCSRMPGDADLEAVLAGRLRLGPPGSSGSVRSGGEAVRQVQKVLIALDYLAATGATGRFDGATAQAVSWFKTDRQIAPSDPVVDDRTLRALDVGCRLVEGDHAKISDATRYLAVAGPSKLTTDEWRGRIRPVPVHQDYALLKVLHNLRRTGGRPIPVHHFQHDRASPQPLDFSGLRDSDVIFIAGHGNTEGLYAMGPDPRVGLDRLVRILTGDGNLRRRRQGKQITILLLSCRAGLGFYRMLAKRLGDELAIRTVVGGATGFTFGSLRTASTGYNEVLIRGIPWYVEYPAAITARDAEIETSRREGRTITIAGKQPQLTAFQQAKEALEEGMKSVATDLRSTEVNAALDEIDTRFPVRWRSLLEAQFELYLRARTASDLEFDMWTPQIDDGYLWTESGATTDRELDALLAGKLKPVTATLTCTR